MNQITHSLFATRNQHNFPVCIFGKVSLLQLAFSLLLSASVLVPSVLVFLPNKMSLITLKMVTKINLTNFLKISNPYDHRSADRMAQMKMATSPNNDISAAYTKNKTKSKSNQAVTF